MPGHNNHSYDALYHHNMYNYRLGLTLKHLHQSCCVITDCVGRVIFIATCVIILRFIRRVIQIFNHMSRLMRKPTICIGENKDADQLRGNREADQRLCFRYSDSTIPLLLKSDISSF